MTLNKIKVANCDKIRSSRQSMTFYLENKGSILDKYKITVVLQTAGYKTLNTQLINNYDQG